MYLSFRCCAHYDANGYECERQRECIVERCNLSWEDCPHGGGDQLLKCESGRCTEYYCGDCDKYTEDTIDEFDEDFTDEDEWECDCDLCKGVKDDN